MSAYSEHSVLDLFSGHGIGVALRNLGVKTEHAVDNARDVNLTRTANGLSPVVYQDVWDAHLVPGEWVNHPKRTLWASPVCPTFSAAGKGSGRKQMPLILDAIKDGTWRDIDELRAWSDELEDVRTGLTLVPLHYIHRFEPMYVAMEQVPAVLPIWEAYAEVLREWGYSVATAKLTSEIAGRWAALRGAREEVHLADWRPYGVYNPWAGRGRNKKMVALGADVCLAFIRAGSSGATHCADYAEECGIDVRRFRA